MKNDQFNDECLKEMIQALPDREVPVGLNRRIMAEISLREQTFGRKVVQFLTSSFTLDFQPFRLAGAACLLVFIFWLGLITGDNRDVQDDSVKDPFSSLEHALKNAEASFYLGRGLLAMGQADEAVHFLRKASRLVPDNPEYTLWEGVALGKVGNKKDEQDRYSQTLDRHPGYVQARLFLGHTLLENGQADAALEEYSRVLLLQPDAIAALYNSALAYQLIGQEQKEAEAWKKYLQLHRTGSWAYRAVEHLNELGDFTYRIYQIGFRRVVFNQELLLGPDSINRQREINFLSSIFHNASGDVLELVAFQSGNAALANDRVMSLKDCILEDLGGETRKRVSVSWFAQPEEVHSLSGKTFTLSRSLLIFSKPQVEKPEEKTI